MTFPATEKTLHEHVTDTRAAAARLRARILALKNESARASVSTSEFISLHSTITDRIAEWDAVVLITGIDTYAATMYPDRVGLVWSTEIASMKTAAVAIASWIRTNIHSSRLYDVDNDGRTTATMVTTAAAAGFRTEADDFLAVVV